MTTRWIHSLLRSARIQISRISPLSNDIAALISLLQHNQIDLIFDVGANVGQYAKELITNGYHGHIVSFEPLSDAHQELLEKSRNNPLWEVAERCCIGNREDTIVLHKAINPQASSVLPVSKTHASYFPDAHTVALETAPMYLLDQVAPSYLKRGLSPFLKIDVQGYEEQVLAGACETIPKLLGLQVELSLVRMYEGQKLFTEMLTEIEKAGFDLYFLMPASRLENGRWLQADCVFFRSSC
jgi:FkbM family methyltransferase